MAFNVYLPEPQPFQQFGDRDSYEIVEGGVLKITRDDGTKLLINPALWARIEEAAAP